MNGVVTETIELEQNKQTTETLAPPLAVTDRIPELGAPGATAVVPPNTPVVIPTDALPPPASPPPSQSTAPASNNAEPAVDNPAAGPSASPIDEGLKQGQVSSILGKVDLLTPEEEKRFNAAEQSVSCIWSWYVLTGDALEEIKSDRLYRNDHRTFEQYYQIRWGYNHAQVYRYIDAAKMYHELEKLRPEISELPDHESLIRPLIGLDPDKAREIWTQIVEKARGRRILASMVAREVRRAKQANPQPDEIKAERQQRHDRRKVIKQAFDELLLILIKRAEHELAAKVTALQRQVTEILGPKKPQTKISRPK